MPQVNPEILRWARETAGLSLQEAAEKVGINDARGVDAPDRLAALEAGEAEPSRPTLLKMAAQYRRPLITFYMAAPPSIAPRGEDFRTLPEGLARRDTALVDTLLREVKARQEMVRSLLDTEDEAHTLPFIGSFDRGRGAAALANAITQTLGLSLDQYRRGNGAGSPRGFAYLRDRAEAAGIFVLLIGDLGSYRTALDVDLFRGFALADEVAPFVVINDRDSDQAWSFTLLHELAHLWLGETGVSGSRPGTPVEMFCNDVAGRILLPADDVAREGDLRAATIDEVLVRIAAVADRCQVSYSMVAYKMYRAGQITEDIWVTATGIFRRRWLENRNAARDARDDNTGPDYYVVRRHRLGTRLVSLTKRMLKEGALSPSKAAAILGVKPNAVYPLTRAA